MRLGLFSLRGWLEKIVLAHRQLLGADELYGVPLDGVQGGVGSVAGVGRGRGGQGHVRLATLCNLDPSDCHQLHQLQIQMCQVQLSLTLT